MKYGMIWTCFCVLVLGAWADNAYRDFTNAQGQTIRGRVLSFDARKGVVQIESESGKRARIPIAGLSEPDQVYVREWDAAQDFMNELVFKIRSDDRQLDESKEEVRKDITWSNTGGTIKDRLMNTIYREKIAFEFEFKNSSTKTLSGIRMDYRIYYEQSKTSDSGRKPEPEQKVYKGKKELADIASGDVLTLMTDPVEVYRDDINLFDQQLNEDTRQGGVGEVHGIRARLYLKLSSGEEVMREFSQPSSMKEERFPW